MKTPSVTLTRLHISMALLSASLIAFQLVLMQIFSIVQWHHFAAMVISIALLGFGASGTIIALGRSWLLKRTDVLLPLLMILSGLLMATVVKAIQVEPLRFDSYLVFMARKHVLALLLNYLILALPFFFGALALGLSFVEHVARIGGLYCANLLGSAVGGGIAYLAFGEFSPQQLPAVVSLLATAAGLCLLPVRYRTCVWSLSMGALVLALYLLLSPARLILSEYKGISRALNLPDARIVLERNSPQGFVQIVSSPALRSAPGLSLNYQKPIPIQQAVFNNGDGVGPVVTWSRADTMSLLDYTTVGLPYAIKRRERVLVLQARTCAYVAQAVGRGALRVVAVEPHTALLSLLKHELAATTDSLLYHPAVRVHDVDPRTFLLTDTLRYDAILLPTLDAFGGTVGLTAMQENYVLTKEAFRDMWDRLTPDGVICLSSWVDVPLRSPLKAFATIAEMLSEVNVTEPRKYLAAARSWGMITFLVKRTPLTIEEVRNARTFCRMMSFDPALLPGLDPAERTRFNQLTDNSLFDLLDRILLPERAELYDRYDFNIRPATDDRPYFSQFLRWGSISRLREMFGAQQFPFLEVGSLIAVLTFVQVSVVAVLLIIAPLFRTPLRDQSRRRILLYFGVLGAGYMFVEIVLIQKFTLFFGHPVQATAAVIGGMLLCSGMGSLVSMWCASTAKVLRGVAASVAALILLYGFFLSPVMRASIVLPVQVKIIVAGVLIAPLAFVMGIPFPLGLRLLSQGDDRQVAWAWGVNGCLSVVSTSAAILLAAEGGLFLVLLCGALMYVAAMFASRFSA